MATAEKAITKKQQAINDRNEARERLRDWLPPGTTVYTSLKHVSRSGMFRRITVHAVINGEISDITWNVSRACGITMKDGALGVSGCGMDMGFHVVYELSHSLYPNGHTCIGNGCPSNDHSNGDRNREPHQHADGGYALIHRWI